MVCKKKQTAIKHQEQVAKIKKIKEEQQLLKNEKKNALKEAKAAAKLALKSTPDNALSVADAIDDINEIVVVTTNANSCAQILKTGLFKGDPCNKPIYKKNMCKRHFNLSNAKLLDVLPADNGTASALDTTI